MKFPPINTIHSNRLNFKYLPAFAAYIKDHKLKEYVLEQLRLSKEVDLPLLRFFKNVSDEQLIEFSMVTSTQFLTNIAENKAEEQIRGSLKQWVSDKLPQVGRNNVSAEDIPMISYVRKQAFLHLIAEYSEDIKQVVELVKEIDQFTVAADAASFQTYIGLLDERINEHMHFIEKIAETSPGFIYVYDLNKNDIIYSNGKAKELLGYSHEEMESMQGNLLDLLEHPDDKKTTIEYLQDFKNVSDTEVRSFQHRIRTKEGTYKWAKNYETIFKRDENGVPAQIIGIIIDTEKEIKMAEELSAREEQLLEAQEVAAVGSFTWNLKTSTYEVTPQLSKILELNDSSELPDFLNKVHPADRPQLRAAIDHAIANGGIYDSEFRFFGKETEKVVWSRGFVSIRNGLAETIKGTIMDITERHHIIHRLKRSEDLYKQAQALTHLGNWNWDINRNKITWTDEMYRIFGLEPQSLEITFGTLLSYLHQQDKKVFLKKLSDLQNKEIRQAEYLTRIILKDGTLKILDIRAEVLFDENGVAFKILGTCQDVTEQKLNEKRLRENQNFLKKIADATPSIIATYNTHTGRYLFVNKAVEKLLGYEPEQILNEGAAFFVDKIHPDDLNIIMEKNSKALEIANAEDGHAEGNEMIVEFKYRMRHIDGTYRWFHTYGTVFDRNERKEVEHVLNISHDITEHVEAEKRLEEQEHLIQHIAEASPNILFLFDINTDSIVYINKEISAVLGYQPTEILDMGSDVRTLLFHPDDQEKIACWGSAEIDDDRLIQYECRMKEKGKNWRWLLVREIPFEHNKEGKALRLLCAALDISDRKEIELELKQKTFELEQSNANLEEFAYVASHDLKEPLRKISSFGDRLLNKEKEKLQNDSRVFLDKIIDSSVRMQKMIDDLLSISLISGDKTFEKYSLKTLVDEVLQTLEYKIEEKKVTVEVDDLPEAQVIPSQFRQLFQNLISNSIKFARTNEKPHITITHTYLNTSELEKFHLNNSDRFLQLTFTDNGIGFNEKYSEKIFSIFQRLHGRSEYEGTGIGLAICRKIVENHGGKIYATGVENEGANFTIIIPA